MFTKKQPMPMPLTKGAPSAPMPKPAATLPPKASALRETLIKKMQGGKC